MMTFFGRFLRSKQLILFLIFFHSSSMRQMQTLFNALKIMSHECAFCQNGKESGFSLCFAEKNCYVARAQGDIYCLLIESS